MMNRVNKVLSSFTVIALFVISVIIIRLYPLKLKPRPAVRTTVGSYQISTAIGNILGPGDITLEALLPGNSQNDLRSNLVSLFRHRGFNSAAEVIAKPDGWGHPYHIEWRTNLIDKSLPILRANKNALLIWSSGENGINEYGSGDDYFDSTDWRDYIECYKQNILEGWDESSTKK